MKSLRSSTEIFLIGHEYSQIVGTKLPSVKQVLCVFFYNHCTLKLTIRESAALVVQETCIFWSKARIPVRKEQHCIEKVEKLYKDWQNLNKNKNKDQHIFRDREAIFTEALDNIFDIAHADVLTLIDDTKKAFLLSQREKGRPGHLPGEKELNVERQKLKRKEDRENAEEIRKRKYVEESSKTTESIQGIFSSSESENGKKSSDSEISFANVNVPAMQVSEPGPGPVSQAKKFFFTSRMLSALDKCKISDRSAMHLLSAIAEALGYSMNELILNRTTLRRYRQQNREEIAAKVKAEFQFSTGVVHWDGKLLPDLTGNKTVDRLPVIISHTNGEQLLGVPKIARSSGIEMAEAIYENLVDWRATKDVVAACFDTTYANSGRLNGAAVILEQKLERSLLYIPCRHHILEIGLRAAFECKMGSTSGVNVPLFVRFRDSWNALNHTNFKAGIDDHNVQSKLEDIKLELAEFCNNELRKNIARDDFKELLEISLIFLGMMPADKIKFRIPGPMHHARWMSKAIYSLKIFIFRNEFKLTAREEKSLQDICVFILKFYIKMWFQATSAVKAPNLDLNYLREIYNHKSTDEKLSMAVMGKICNHLWYLSDECVALSFFDEQVPSDEKRRMLLKLNLERDIEIESAKRIQLKINDVKEFVSKRLSDLVTPNTNEFFDRFKIPKEFLFKDPDTWASDDDYKTGTKIVSQIKVVNDVAERGVKLIQEYNKKITHNEDDMQFLLQVVKDYTQKFSSFTKKSLTED